MDNELLSFKELYDVYLKATYNIEIGNRTYEVGEPIAHFDKIQIAGLQEMRQSINARGGFQNAPRVYWDSTKEVDLSFSQGVFSKQDFALLVNSGVVQPINQDVYITTTERLELDENKNVELAHEPSGTFFIYNEEGTKIGYERAGTVVYVPDLEPYSEVIVTYQYDYVGESTFLAVGRQLITGYLQLEGKTRVKEDTYGTPTTALIVIPKLKLASGLSIRLGAQANPVVANFQAKGVPYGERGTQRVCEIYFLESDLDSDM